MEKEHMMRLDVVHVKRRETRVESLMHQMHISVPQWNGGERERTAKVPLLVSKYNIV